MKHFYYVLCVLLLIFSQNTYAGDLKNGKYVSRILLDPPVITGNNQLCGSGSTILTATISGTGTINWYDVETGGSPIGTGSTFATSALNASKTFYADVTDGAITSTRTAYTVTINPLPVASFSAPTSVSCATQALTFTNSSTGANLTYQWNFGNPDSGNANTSTQQNPSHTFVPTPGNGEQTFTVTLTATNSVTGCSDSTIRTVKVKQLPHSAINTSSNPYYNVDQGLFINCSATQSDPNFLFEIANGSTTIATNTSYIINWGDSPANETMSSFATLSHQYTSLGLFTITLTTKNSVTGCDSVKTYQLFNGNSPQGGLLNPGNVNDCAPYSITWQVDPNTFLNAPGTEYIFAINDGSNPQTFTQATLPTSITHLFTTSSCGVPTNAFTISFTLSNPCETVPQSIGIVRPSQEPEAKFTISDENNICEGKTITLTNESIGNYFTQGASCSNVFNKIWTITPATGWTLLSGQLNGTDVITVKFNTAGSYSINLNIKRPNSTSSRCTEDTLTKTICVKSPLQTPNIALTNISGCSPVTATGSITSTIGTNNCTSPVTYQWNVRYQNATPGCGTNGTPQWSYTNNTSQTSANPSFNFITPGDYYVKVTINNGCTPAESIEQKITVKEKPTALINNIPNACGASSVTINPTATVTNCGTQAPTYLWTAVGGTLNDATLAAPTITYTSAGNYTVTVKVSNECGISAEATKTFTVSPPLTVNAGTDKTICPGGTGEVLNGSGGGGNGSFTYQWTPATGLSSSTILTPTATPSVTTTYKLKVKEGGCEVEDEVTVYVNTVVAGNIAGGQTICSGGDPTELTVATVASGAGTLTYQWQSSTTNDTSGFSDIPSGTSATYDPAAGITQNTWFRRKTISTLNGKVCESVGNVILVIVNNVTAGIISGNHDMCSGGDPFAFVASTAATGSGTLSYQWQNSPDNTTFTNIAGATSSSYDAPPLTQTTYYRRIATSMLNAVSCSVISNVITVNIVPDPVVDTQPLSTQTICQNSTATALSVTVSGGFNNYNYQWYYNGSASTSGATAVSGPDGQQPTYTPPTNLTGIRYYYVEVSQVLLGCNVTSSFAKVEVIAAPSVTSPAQNIEVCQGGTAGQLSAIYSNGTGTPSYQWYKNAMNSSNGGTPIPSATSPNYTPDTLVTGITYYYAEITFFGGSCSAIKTPVSKVEVKSVPVITGQPQPEQTICVGGVIPALSFSFTGGAGTVIYQWYSNTSNSNTTGTAIPGATGVNYTPNAFSAEGSYHFYVTVSFGGNGCTAITSDVAKVIVVADPVVTAQPVALQTLCESATPQNLEVTATGGAGTLQYQWYSNTAANTTTGTPIATATAPSYTPLTTVVGSTYYYCVITTAASGCSTVSNIAQVIVNPSPTVTTHPAGSTVCLDGAPTLLSVAYANGTGTASYQWYEGTSATPSGGSAINGETASTYQPLANVEGTRYYYCVITFSSVGCNSITSDVATVVVKPDPTISSQPITSQEVCVGGTISALTVAHTGGHGTPTYQWYSNTTASTTGSTLITGATSSSYTPSTNAIGTLIYYVVITLSGNGCGSTTSNFAEIKVVADPTITSPAFGPQTLCESIVTTAQPLTVTATGGSGSPYTYQWYANAANSTSGGTAILNANTDTYTPPTAATGTFYYYCEVATPVSGCSVFSSVAKVEVKPAPTFTTQPQSANVCHNQTPAPLTVAYTNGTGTATYQWYSNTSASTSGATPVGTNTNTYQPQGTTVGTTYYFATVTFSSGGCSVITSSFAQVNINPLTEVVSTETATICSGQQFTVSPVHGSGNNVPSGTTYTWSAPTGTGFTGGSAQTTPQSNISQTLTNTTASPVTATCAVTPAYNGCTGNPFTITVTVNPKATIANAAATICSGGTFTVDPVTIPSAIVPANTTYTWSAPVVTGGLTGGQAGAGQSVVTGTLTNPTTATQTATYTVTPASTNATGTCTGQPFNVVVTVKPQLTVTSVLSDFNNFEISTAGGSDGAINLTVTGGSGSYTYAWTGPGTFTSTAEDLNGLTVGIYTVTVTDGLCTAVVIPFNIREPLPLVIQEVLSSHVNVNCFGQTTGIVEVEITQPSIAPFDYEIILQGGGVIESVPNLTALNYVFDNLAAGTYDIKVIDANGTVKTITGIIVTQPASGLAISNAAVSNHNGFSITCNGANNGSIDLTITGGYPAYTYSWTGPNGFTETTKDISNLSPGTYTVVIGDSTNVCTLTQSYTITEPQPVTFTGIKSDYNGFGVSCSGGSNGTINITPTGGTSAYIYQWTGPNGFSASSQNLTGLFAGTYTLNLSDSNGCIATQEVYTLTEPLSMTITETHTNLLCHGASTGTVSVNVSGGVPGASGYLYSWVGPNGFIATTQNLANVMAGTYILTVTDASGCSAITSVTLTQPSEITIVPTQTAISCYGANDASLSLAISGGVGSYQVTWNNFASGTFQDNLAAGTYVITVKDSNNCIKVISVVIPEAPIFTINPVHTNISCHGANDGSIVLNLVGGQAPVSLVWNDDPTAGNARFNLPAGTYTVTITDSKPCIITRSFIIVEPQPLTLGGVVTNADNCTNTMSGAINLLPAGGSPPFTFSWSNGATTEDLNGITSGNYAVTVTDSRGCSVSRQFQVTRPLPLEVTVTSNVDFNCTTKYVMQTNTATASGGVPPYLYSWSSGTVSGQGGRTMTTNQNGSVTVNVTDLKGCTATHTFEVDTQQLGDISHTITSYGFETYGLYSIIDPIQFTNTSTGDFISVSWNFGDGSVSDEESPTHSYQREGTYVVTQTVVYPYGCISRKTIRIDIEKGYNVMIPDGFTPNADGINDAFNAQHTGLKSIQLDVYDTWGSMIYSEKGETLRGWDGNVNGVSAENGNFLYRIKAETFYGSTVNYEGPLVLIK